MEGFRLFFIVEGIVQGVFCANRNVERYVEELPREAGAYRDKDGRTALFIAAARGSRDLAEILLRRFPESLHIRDLSGKLPIHAAAEGGHGDLALFLFQRYPNDPPLPDEDEDEDAVRVDPPLPDEDGDADAARVDPPLTDEDAAWALSLLCVISPGSALRFVEQCPKSAQAKPKKGLSPLEILERKYYSFESGHHPTFWEELQRYCCCIRPKSCRRTEANLKNGTLLHFCNCPRSRPKSKIVYDEVEAETEGKLGELVEVICGKINDLENKERAWSLADPAILHAIEFGVHGFVKKALSTLRFEVWCRQREGSSERDYQIISNLFRVAMENRQIEVLSAICSCFPLRFDFCEIEDADKNTIYHMAAKKALPHRLNLISSSALQMQQEIKWFTHWGNKFAHQEICSKKNKFGKTAVDVFREEHEDLVEKGQRWMKETASSCTFVAALIIAAVFAAVITVPGGNDQTFGRPLLYRDSAFFVFAITNALTFFSSTASVIIFLSIQTARYNTKDFIIVLPGKLILGLITLLISLASMMVAFTAVLYLLFGQKNIEIVQWAITMAVMPVSLYAFLQFPLLKDIIRSTLGCSVFHNQSNRSFLE